MTIVRNIRMTVAYDGTDFVGWQVQANGLSIQTVITDAIRKRTGEAVALLSAGRTDSGVHALGQVASFRTSSRIPCDGLRKLIQSGLPDSILIRSIEDAPPNFHATFSARRKRYRYVIHNSRQPIPFLRRYAWHFHPPLDVQAMHQAAQCLLGRHDFRSFESHWPNKATSVRTLMEVTVQRQWFCPLYFQQLAPGGPPDPTRSGPTDAAAGEFIWLDFVADGFLYNMVRTLVGTLVHVGRGRWSAADVTRIIAAMNREAAGDTAPAHGLCLVEVDYDDRPA